MVQFQIDERPMGNFKSYILQILLWFFVATTASAQSLSSASVEQLAAIFEFLVTGRIPQENGLVVDVPPHSAEAQFVDVSFRLHDNTRLITITEPVRGRLQDMDVTDIDIRSEQADAIFGAVPKVHQTTFAKRMVEILDHAIHTAPLDRERLRYAASYGLQSDLVQLFFESGDTSVLRLFSWLMEWNDEVRNWQLYDFFNNKQCLSARVEDCHPESKTLTQRFDPDVITLRELQFAFAILAGLLFDPIGWSPVTYADGLSLEQRDVLAVSTLTSFYKIIRFLNFNLERYGRRYPQLVPTAEKMKPFFQTFLTDYRSVESRSGFARMQNIVSFRNLLSKMRTALVTDSYFRADIGAPGAHGPARAICMEVLQANLSTQR